jgi:hypothetical protein
MSSRVKDLFFQLIALLKIERRQLPVFFFLIVLSAIFWVLTVLSKDYTATIHAKAQFVDFPSDKLLIEEKEVGLQLQVNAPGFSLLAYKFKIFKKIPLSVDGFISKRKGKLWEYFWIGEQSLAEVQEELPASMQLLHVQPNRIDLLFGEKSQKTVPVKLKSDLSFASMFRQKGAVKLTPDHVVISGPKTIVELIDFVSTKELYLANIEHDELGSVLLEDPKHPELNYSQDELEWELIVEQFTEGKTDIPLRVKGLPRGYEIKLFPEEVSAHYLVSLDDFELLNPSMFKAEVEFSETKKRLTVTLSKHASFVENIRITPSKVEYIVIKK